MRRCVIVAGAPIKDGDGIRSLLREDDFFLYCDSGLDHLSLLGGRADLVVGDFDSFHGPLPPCEVIRLPREKDDTDSFFAVREALARGFEEFLVLGAVGKRFDHSLGNVSVLLYLDSLGKSAVLADDYSEMEIVSCKSAFVEDRYPYFSLLNVTGLAENVRIRGAKYPLEGATIPLEHPYAVSNETLSGQTAEITVGEGRLLLIKVRSNT